MSRSVKSASLLREIGVALVYGLWAILLTVPLIFRIADGLPKYWGDSLLNTWILSWESQALLRQPHRLLDAPVFYPHRGTLTYSELLLGILPFALPFNLATGIPALGYNVAFLFSYWVSAMGMRRLIQALGGGHRAAFIAGLLFAALPYRAAHIIHLHLLYVGWIPLAMAALIRYVHRPTRRRAVDLALSVLLMATSSWHLAVFGMIAICVLLISLIWERGLSLHVGIRLIGIALVCGAAILPIAWPYLQTASALSESRTLAAAQWFSAWPVDLLAASPELRFLGPLTAPFRVQGHTNHEVQLYPGLTLIGAAAVGLSRGALRSVKSIRQTVLALMGIGMLMALGPFWQIGSWRIPGPYGWVAALFPGVLLIRATARWFILTLIGLSIAAGMGFRRLLRKPRWMPSVLVILFSLLEGWIVPMPIVALPRLADLPPAYHWLARQPDPSAVLELPVFLPVDDNETFRMYAGLLHRKPLVIAYSGYIPPDIREIRERLRAFPSSTAIEEIIRLSAMGVRYLLVDASKEELRDFYPKGLCEISRNPHFTYIGPMYPHYVFEVHPTPDVPPPAIMKPVMAKFGEVAILQAYGLRQLAPGQLEVWLLWMPGWQPHGNYSIMVQVLERSMRSLAQRDGPPRNGGYLFDCWQPGEQIVDRRVLQGDPVDLRRAAYLAIAVYDWLSLQRVPIQHTEEHFDMLLLPLNTGEDSQ